ncbi:hypothetical protein J2S74_002579 [Evansella vedderi]|uniref:Uncharacterized protein n=1 Tax=Evansella vedderi TaxID=38282 RepID=A0ABT9ZVC4_9BACI|nr:hypothetical protein [Evansella vedderi]MDQ0255197.1 hypothetical protein [Evansella vedderi]
MDFLTVLVLIVIGFVLLRIVGKILKFVIGVGIVGLIIYVLATQFDAAAVLLNITV